MRRALRRLFTILSALPLLLCVAVLISWAVSFRHPHSFVWGRYRSHAIVAAGGVVQYRQEFWRDVKFDASGAHVVETTPDHITFIDRSLAPDIHGADIVRLSRWRPFGSGYVLSGGDVKQSDGRYAEYGAGFRAWGIAHWVIALPLVLLLVWRASIERMARRRSRQGHCPTCGYDLRAHNPGDRCPECGMISSPARSLAQPKV